MPSRARDRHLAKNAERRRQARRQAKRNKTSALGVGGVIALVLVVLGVIGLLSRRDNEQAAQSASPSASLLGTPHQTGTVRSQAKPPATVACGAEVPKAADQPKPQFDSAPSPDAILKPDTTYTAVVETSCGTIKIELDEQAAPQTVASFVFLAEQGYFDGQIVHRVVDSIDVIQSGDPTGTGGGGPGYAIPDELQGQEHYAPGTLAMANGGPGTGGSQFFLITGREGANLDGNPAYTIFGHVTEGLDVAKQINALMPTTDGSYDGPPTEAAYIEKVTIETAKKPTATPSPSG